MKTIPARRLACLCLAVVSALPPVLPAAEVKPGSPKTHVLFMGADLAVQRDKNFYRVEDVTGSEFKIRIGKKDVFVSTRGRQTGLKVDHGLKLATTSVKLDNLQSGAAYTTANDPGRKFAAASGAAGGSAAMVDLAQGQVMVDMLAVGMTENAAALQPDRPLAQEAWHRAEAVLAETERKANVIGQMNNYDSQNNVAYHADQMKQEQAEGNFDAMEVSFKISSPVELDDPYMVVLFKFQNRDAKPGEEGMVIHAKSLEPIGPKPKYIRVLEGGLPLGFKYLDCVVHIYNRGEEVATNVSPKRVELTRGEAQQYQVMEYIGAHKKATVPAIAVRGSLPPPRRQQLSLDQLNRTCYAKVAKDGRLLGVYADEGCTLQISDDAAVAAVDEVFFNPSLHEGKPVEGIARFRLAEL